MKVFVVSIEEDNSFRLNNLLNQPFFKKNNINYTRIGINGGQFSAKEYFELAVKGRSRPLTPAELGCSLSHLKILNEFLNTEDEYALIFEDDAIIPSNLRLNLLEEAIKQLNLPLNSLLSLGGIQMKICHKVRGKIKKQKFLNKTILEVNPNFYNRVNYAFAYIVDRVMAKNLVDYHERIRKADDWSYLFDFNDQSHIFMTYLVDHPVISKGETDVQLSRIEAERAKSVDLPISRYGKSIKKFLAKIQLETYPL